MSYYISRHIFYSFLFANGMVKILFIKELRFMVIIYCFIFATMLIVQLQNIMQRKIYKKYGIKRKISFLIPGEALCLKVPKLQSHYMFAF
jgi:hypothetical protein